MSSTNAFFLLRSDCLTDLLPAISRRLVFIRSYLTIEAKCPELSGKESHALNKNLAASHIRVYQRLQLKIALNSDHLNEIDSKDLRYYSIVIDTKVFSVWRTTYDLEKKTYHMQILEFYHITDGAGIL